ncbi:MAG: 5-Hydroxyisourate Hydrolase [Myxococcaceae bacterium]|nr:5-Hydroxyisourate Hydrolase [Myxococcaceae bacterium]
MNSITTHVLDTARGRPAASVSITLEYQSADGWTVVGAGVTDDDGRLRTLLPADALIHLGVYRLTFDTDGYFNALGLDGFFPEAVIVFRVRDGAQHHHVPLLLSPFGYSTYRGS